MVDLESISTLKKNLNKYMDGTKQTNGLTQTRVAEGPISVTLNMRLYPSENLW